jgi:hypothetical protein
VALGRFVPAVRKFEDQLGTDNLIFLLASANMLLRKCCTKIPLFLLTAVLFSGCSTTPPIQVDESKSYQRNVTFTMGKLKSGGSGTWVVPEAKSYPLTIHAPKGVNFDFAVLKTCHRFDVLWKQGDDFDYEFTPEPGIEDNRACPLEVYGTQKDKAIRALGYFDHETAAGGLPAVLKCNSDPARPVLSVAACESGVGMIQQVIFSVPVDVEALTDLYPACVMPEPKDGRTYEWKMPRGDCNFQFMEQGGAHRVLRLNTHGIEEVLPKG